jgi:hypothetical protein
MLIVTQGAAYDAPAANMPSSLTRSEKAARPYGFSPSAPHGRCRWAWITRADGHAVGRGRSAPLDAGGARRWTRARRAIGRGRGAPLDADKARRWARTTCTFVCNDPRRWAGMKRAPLGRRSRAKSRQGGGSDAGRGGRGGRVCTADWRARPRQSVRCGGRVDEAGASAWRAGERAGSSAGQARRRDERVGRDGEANALARWAGVHVVMTGGQARRRGGRVGKTGAAVHGRDERGKRVDKTVVSGASESLGAIAGELQAGEEEEEEPRKSDASAQGGD